MPRTTTRIAQQGYIADAASITRNDGRQIAWARVPDTFKGSDGAKVLKAGTVIGQTAAGQAVPRAATYPLGTVVVASNVATATQAAHGYSVGDRITVSGASLAYVNGEKTILAVPDANTLTFAAVGANATSTGTVVGSYASVGLLETGANDQDRTASLSGYGVIVGGVIYETLLPDAAGSPRQLPAAYKAELAAAGVSTGFVWAAYVDSRAS